METFPTPFPIIQPKARARDMTIKDIARISGCSVSTISRVINDRPDVRPETKEHVLKVMREAGFTPNTNARQLKIQQSRSLVFVVKGTRNIFFSDFLVQLQRAATLYGYNGIVSYLELARRMEDIGVRTLIFTDLLFRRLVVKYSTCF